MLNVSMPPNDTMEDGDFTWPTVSVNCNFKERKLLMTIITSFPSTVLMRENDSSSSSNAFRT